MELHMGILGDKKTIVYWTVSNKIFECEDEVWFEPEKILPRHNKERKDASKDCNFAICPGHIDYMKNVFLLRSPMDITLDIDTKTNTITNTNLEPSIVPYVLMARSVPTIDKHLTVSLRFAYIFMTKEPVVLEEISPFFEHDFCHKFNIIPGEFRIDKWIRNIDIAFEIIDGVSRLEIKRGDPLCYVRLRTLDNSIVKLVRVEDNNSIREMNTKCTNVKNFLPGQDLEKNYSMMEKAIRRFWPKIGCPFKKY